MRRRGGASRAPLESSARPRSRRSSSAEGGRIRSRAVASSIASGRPSSLRQISWTLAALASVRSNSPQAARARSEQLNRFGSRQVFDAGAVRQAQRRNRKQVLANHLQRAATGSHDAQARARGEQCRNQRHCFEQVLEVVQHEQHTLIGNIRGERGHDLGSVGIRQFKRGGDHTRDEGWVQYRGERHKDEAIGKHIGGGAGDGQRQPRLAHPARTGQRQQTVAVAQQT